MVANKFPIPEGDAETPWEPATEEEVQEVERALGSRLPDDYREFLLTVNGIRTGYPLLGVSLYNEISQRVEYDDLCVLYTASKNARETAYILNQQRDYGFDVRVPKRFLIIGRTLGQDQFCMSLSGPDRGHVFLWHIHEAEPKDWEKNSEEWLFHRANSFTAFWQRIEVPKNYWEEP